MTTKQIKSYIMANNDNGGCGCSTLILIIIAIALITMCNRLTDKPKLKVPEKEYIIVYPDGSTCKQIKL